MLSHWSQCFKQMVTVVWFLGSRLQWIYFQNISECIDTAKAKMCTTIAADQPPRLLPWCDCVFTFKPNWIHWCLSTPYAFRGGKTCVACHLIYWCNAQVWVISGNSVDASHKLTRLCTVSCMYDYQGTLWK